ncbi:MAG TPA: hypothetical protein DCW50_07500 [Gammaproteobacteria bacterium]|nr:MAG: hypothetical protein CBC15_08245 [Candidatus Endolissoclinum sp. TMED55]HAU41876.1 hypothetical protein [Gammaproteobacteria bacterium]HBP83534.1 hypothetical protein [Gammaproteobacteria bacterium]
MILKNLPADHLMVRQNGTNTLLTRIFHVVFAHRFPQITIVKAKFLSSFFESSPVESDQSDQYWNRNNR